MPCGRGRVVEMGEGGGGCGGGAGAGGEGRGGGDVPDKVLGKSLPRIAAHKKDKFEKKEILNNLVTCSEKGLHR